MADTENPSARRLSPFDTRMQQPIQQALLVLAAVAVSVQCYLLLVVPPATEFETSIVRAYPLPFWACFGITIGAVIAVFLSAAIDASTYWRRALVLLACEYGIFFALPVMRGYKLYGRGNSDALVHLGDTKEILATGQISDQLIYPVEHLLLSTLTMVGIPLDATRYVLPYVFTLLFVCSVGLLIRQLTDRSRALPLGLCAATPLILTKFQIQIHPAIMSILLFPLIIAVLDRYRRTNSKRLLSLSLMFIFGIIFFHPVTTVLLVLLLLSTVVSDLVYARVHEGSLRRSRPTVAYVVFPIAFEWYFDFYQIQRSIREIVTQTRRVSAGAAEVGQANEVALSMQQIAIRFVQLYGTAFIYLLITGLFCLVILGRIVRQRDTYAESYLMGQFAIGFGISVTFLTVPLIISDPIRVSRYMLVMAVVLVALLLHRSINNRGYARRFVPVLIGGAVVSAAILGAFAAYIPNKHMTQAEYEGAEFMLERYNEELPIRALDVTDNMQQYVTPTGLVDYTTRPFNNNESEYSLASHLGYETNDTAGRSFGHTYLITQQYDTEFYTAEYFTESQQEAQFVYHETDVLRMRRDPTINKVYENGGFKGWYVPERPERQGNLSSRRVPPFDGRSPDGEPHIPASVDQHPCTNYPT
jgi:hypothetical protein